MTSDDLRILVRATATLYGRCAATAAKSLVESWPAVLGAAGLCVIAVAAFSLLSYFGFAGGLLISLVASALLACYYSWIEQIVRNDRIRWRHLASFDTQMFIAVIGVQFVLWLAMFPLQMAGAGKLIPIIYAIVFLVFNPLPEVVAHQRASQLEAFKEAAEFSAENWVEWFVPYVVLLAPVLALSGSVFSLIMMTATPMLPVSPVLMAMSLLLSPYSFYLLGILLIPACHWYMVFRALLFNELRQSSRRKRIYQAKMT